MNRTLQARPRRAFTLIEVLTVVAILAIVLSIVAYGMSKVIGHTKTSATHTTLQNLKSMVAEFKVTAKGLTRQPDHMWLNGAAIPSGGTPAIDIWNDANPNKAGQQALLAPDGLVSLSVASVPNNQRYGSDAVANTQQVMTLLRQAPVNRSTIEKFPPTQLMETMPGGVALSGAKLMIPDPSKPGTSKAYDGTSARPDPAVLLDAWGNPIIFVPSGGLWMVTAGDVQHNIDTLTAGANNNPIQSPDHTPFWASAGPDGNFRTGDDNLYSFEE